MRILTFVFVLTACLTVTSSCRNNHPDLQDDQAHPDISKLAGKCFRGRLIVNQACKGYPSYVEVLNQDTGNRASHDGKEYRNVIELSNFQSFSSAKNIGVGDIFYFTINPDSQNCEYSTICQMAWVPIVIQATPSLPKVCAEKLSLTNCTELGEK
jgi:hypothetical protein